MQLSSDEVFFLRILLNISSDQKEIEAHKLSQAAIAVL